MTERHCQTMQDFVVSDQEIKELHIQCTFHTLDGTIPTDLHLTIPLFTLFPFDVYMYITYYFIQERTIPQSGSLSYINFF